MRLNDLRPASGSKRTRKRRGRGSGTGLGKTGGRGHKGQKSRAGGSVPRRFEGGQMPLQRRLPKFGFVSRTSVVRQDVRISSVNGLQGPTISLDVLKSSGIVGKRVKNAKLFGNGKVNRAYNIQGLSVTKGALKAIETAGGQVDDGVR